ncbi:MAG: succinate dehydrogenase cytochrome b subunit [Elusimicrobia bacterium]|nr:succinate dehydrogenase cytochrome b subunit [Elusimicrobiota bacterium]
MGWLTRLLSSSIGKKTLVAAAGLLLCGFLITHLAGNLLLVAGENSFNRYAEALESNPLIIPAELVLALLFLGHIVMSLRVKYENRKARPAAYVMSVAKGGRTPGSRTMIYSGLILLAFVIIHIKTFKFGDKSFGLYRLVIDSFQNNLYTAFYVLAMALLGFHLSHGFWSAFQTLGVSHPKYTPLIKRTGLVFAVVIAGGFAFLPLWARFSGSSMP